jgi:hypothetical protein
MKKLGFTALTALFLIVGGCGGDDDGGSGADGGGGGGGDGTICSSSNPCPDGQFCWNGLCALGCNSDGDCADDQYCDTEFDRLCHNKTVSTCPDTPCADNQICRDGFCSTPPEDTSCMPRPDGNDGCDAYSLCLEEDDESTACYSFPACAEDGSCPTGLVGAVCNDGIVPNKAQMCLTGMCTGTEHCPSSWSCVMQSTDPAGFCSDGQFGSVCLSASDCQQGLDCFQAVPGTLGFCQTGF